MSVVIRIHQHGDPSVLCVEQAEIGDPGPGQVRLRQQAVGVNYFDTMVRRGDVGFPLPAILGVEAAGIVEAVGPGVTGLTVGDRAGYFFDPGAYAEQRLIDATSLIVLPDDISAEQAAAFLAGGLTAWMGLRALHRLKPSDTVLVQGASGGVGAILSRWAKALGATVIGVAGSVAKVATVPAHALWSGDPEFSAKLEAIAPGGVDVAYDLVGRATFAQVASSVRDGGRIVTIGAASGPPRPGADLRRRGVEVFGGSTPQHVNASTVDQASTELFEAIRAGFFADLELARYPLADVARVHRDIAARALTGLPVLTV